MLLKLLDYDEKQGPCTVVATLQPAALQDVVKAIMSFKCMTLGNLQGTLVMMDKQDRAHGNRLAVRDNYFEVADSAAASQVWRMQWIAIRSAWQF